MANEVTTDAKKAYVLCDTKVNQYLKYDPENDVFYWVEQLCCAEFYVNEVTAQQDLEVAKEQLKHGKLKICLKSVSVDSSEKPVDHYLGYGKLPKTSETEKPMKHNDFERIRELEEAIRTAEDLVKSCKQQLAECKQYVCEEFVHRGRKYEITHMKNGVSRLKNVSSVTEDLVVEFQKDKSYRIYYTCNDNITFEAMQIAYQKHCEMFGVGSSAFDKLLD